MRAWKGRAFSIEEHQLINDWQRTNRSRWPRIELALNYPNTPEMLGVIEFGYEGPSVFFWCSENGVILQPFSGGKTQTYVTIEQALHALTHWSLARLEGRQTELLSPDTMSPE